MNLLDLLLIVLLVAVIGRAVYVFVSNRKSGGCGCGCSGCTKGSCGFFGRRKDISEGASADLSDGGKRNRS